MREKCILKNEKEYPQQLRQIRNAPQRLYVRGRLPDKERPSVAIIGARKCSSYGCEMARWFARELASSGVQIISGMACGVDGIAQMAALEVGGDSFGVLGCGTDICYPGENKKLYELLLEKGGVLSEHPAGTPPIAAHFPSRNRIISALSDCVLVIEAKERSGTLITVDFALEQGRDVYALPGRITDGLSSGCNKLLWQGAGLALAPRDILEVLYGKGKIVCMDDGDYENKGGEKDFSYGETRSVPHIILKKREMLVWEQLDERGMGLQELYEKIKLSKAGKNMELTEVMDVLMELVMKEIILPERGNKYRRKNKIRVSTI